MASVYSRVLWSSLRNSSCVYFMWLANIKAINEREEGKVVANSVRKESLLQMEKKKPRHESVEGDEDEVSIALNMVEQINER